MSGTRAPITSMEFRSDRPRTTMIRRHNNNRDWVCPSCQGNNWGRNGYCFRCRVRKPTELLNGDWYCGVCGDYQFRANAACRRCVPPPSKPMPPLAPPQESIDSRAEEGQDTCVVCMENKVTCIMVHGETGHSVTCMGCASKISKCPICRQTIEKRIRVFK